MDICRSAGAILADQLLWRKLKRLSWAVLGHGLQCSKSLTTAISWITTSDLLQIHQSLLTETAVMAPRTQLELLTQRLGAITNLQRRHDSLASS
jgi:hypothetical protein